MRLGSAGRAASARGDFAAAAGLLQRAAELAGDRPERASLLLDAGRALVVDGRWAEGGESLRRAAEDARAHGERAVELRALIHAAVATSRVDPSWTPDGLLALADETIREFEGSGDDAVLAAAFAGRAEVHLELCQWEAAAAAQERGLTHARAVGGQFETAGGLSSLANAVYWGPLPAPEAIERCTAIRAEIQELGLVLAEAHVLYYLGGLEAMRGNFDEARVCIRRGHELFEERGHPYGIATKALVSGPSEALAGDLDAGERNLGEGRAHLASMGETGVYSTLSGMHALVLCDLERWDDAAEAVGASERTTSPDDRASNILIGAAQGRLLAARGSVEEAEAHARKAIAIAETTDFLTMHGDALVALGRVLEAARRAAQAREAFEQAAELYARKGNVVSAGRARELTTAPR